MENDMLDVIIFGATGFTGKYAVRIAARMSKEKGIKFGVAGRRKEALKFVVQTCAPDIEDVPIIIADVKDADSLKKMTGRAKIIANCCGPFKFYGEPVIKACIETKTHHIDVTGESQYMEEMQLKYNKAAQDAGIYIISACGFDCIPCDLGVIYTQQKFDGEINSIEAYFNISSSGSGTQINFGTLESLVYSFYHMKEQHKIREKLYPEKLPVFQPKLKPKSWIPHRTAFDNSWAALFPSSDRSVVYRTQRYLFEKYKQRPVQFFSYITFKSLLALLVSAFFGALIFLFTKFSYGCSLISKYPGLFTCGFITHEPPKEETLKKSTVSVTFVAHGWTEKLSEPTDTHANPPNQQMITKVSGGDAYTVTCVALMLSAVTILKESDKMPKGGGVFTTGAAFGKTSLIDELIKHDVKFEVVSSIEKRY